MSAMRVLCLLALAAVSMASAQQGIFANVDALRKAAAPVLPGVGWKDLGSGLGFFGSSKVELPTTGFVPSTVEYHVSGKSRNRVDEVVISAFISSPRELAAGKTKVEAAVAQWFKSVRKPVPAGLVAAIRAGKTFQSAVGGLSVGYVVERGVAPGIKQPDGTSWRATTMDLKIKPL